MTETPKALSCLERLQKVRPADQPGNAYAWIVNALCAEIDRIEETRATDFARQDRRMDSLKIQIKNIREANASYLARIEAQADETQSLHLVNEAAVQAAEAMAGKTRELENRIKTIERDHVHQH